MVTAVKRLLFGNPLKTNQAVHERLTKKPALAVFSSNALSSTAYATEEILLVLAAAVAFGQGYAFHYVLPISIGIAVLLANVATSYRQTNSCLPLGRQRIHCGEGESRHHAGASRWRIAAC